MYRIDGKFIQLTNKTKIETFNNLSKNIEHLDNNNFTITNTNGYTVGSTFQISHGANVPASYQWQRVAIDNGAVENIPNATSGTYTFSNEDIDHRIQADVIFDNVINTPIISAPTVTIQNNLAVDNSLIATVNDLSITNTDISTYLTYTWKDEDSIIFQTGTSNKYTITSSNVGKNIIVEVSYTLDSISYNISDEFTIPNPSVIISGDSIIDDSSRKGATLTANVENLYGDIIDMNYTWQRFDSLGNKKEDIISGDSNTYNSVSADGNFYIGVDFNYQDSNGDSKTISSNNKVLIIPFVNENDTFKIYNSTNGKYLKYKGIYIFNSNIHRHEYEFEGSEDEATLWKLSNPPEGPRNMTAPDSDIIIRDIVLSEDTTQGLRYNNNNYRFIVDNVSINNIRGWPFAIDIEEQKIKFVRNPLPNGVNNNRLSEFSNDVILELKDFTDTLSTPSPSPSLF